jgi:phosphoribosylanthranilate isomerase
MNGHGRIQIAGIKDQAEADLLVGLGADDLGFPLGPGVATPDTDEDSARAIIATLPARVGAVLITYLADPAEIAATCRRLGAKKVQLHGRLDAAVARELKRVAPGLHVIRSLVVGAQKSSDADAELDAELASFSPHVDEFLTDTFDPATGRRGATGKTHDWAISRRLVERSPRPVILAGGMRPENVAEAIRQVRPASVDVHTGIEGADGRKDAALTRRFIEQARYAFREMTI